MSHLHKHSAQQAALINLPTFLIQCPACGGSTAVMRNQIDDAQAMRCAECATAFGKRPSPKWPSLKWEAAWKSARRKALTRSSRTSAVAERRRQAFRSQGLNW
jgi:hypothetical protein